MLGAIALVAIGDLTPQQAAAAVDLPTLLLLFSFMVISAQMRLGGFHTRITQRVASLPLAPPALMAAVIATVAALSAVFSNDVVCLAIAPVLAGACLRRGLDPVPFLLALACATNIGSAATLIGNPQNMLIGEVLKLPFGGYFLEALTPVLLGLAALWALLVLQAAGSGGPSRGRSRRLKAVRPATCHSTAGRPPRARRWPRRWSPPSCFPICRATSPR